jgi:hypothetical protein
MRTIATVFVVAMGLGIGIRGVASPVSDDPVELPFALEHNEMMLDTDTDPSSINLAFEQSSGFQLRDISGQVTGGGSERPNFVNIVLSHSSRE